MRPKTFKNICCCPKATIFMPQGCKVSTEIELTLEEVEALELKYLKNLDQTEAARDMNTSQSTFQRILINANKKIADGIINGKIIKIQEKKKCC